VLYATSSTAILTAGHVYRWVSCPVACWMQCELLLMLVLLLLLRLLVVLLFLLLLLLVVVLLLMQRRLDVCHDLQPLLLLPPLLTPLEVLLI
jgi:hypothetical protein